MSLQFQSFQNYDPSTKSFKPSQAKVSHNRRSRSKKPGGVKLKLMSGPSLEISEQNVDFSEDKFGPLERLSATTRVIDLTRSDLVPPPEQCRGPLHQNSTGDGNCQVERNVLHGRDDRPSGLNLRPSIIPSQQHDGPSASDVQRSNLAVSGTDGRLPINCAPNGAAPPATLKGTSLDRTNGARSVALTDPSAHDAGHPDPQSLLKKIAQSIIAIKAKDAMPSSTAAGKSEATIPAPIHVESDVEASTDKTDKDQVMVDVDGDVNGHRGQSTIRTSGEPEQGQPAEVAADGEWEITELIGKEVIDGKVHYLVHWKATLVPEHEINAPELIGKFEARFGAKTNKPVGGARVAKKTRLKLRKDGKEMNAARRERPRKDELGH